MNKLIDTGAVAAAYCVADESIDAFRRFHAALYAQQPEETATVFPDNGRLSSTHLAPPASAFVIVRFARRIRSRRRSTSRASAVAATTGHRWFDGSNARATTPPAGDLGRSPQVNAYSRQLISLILCKLRTNAVGAMAISDADNAALVIGGPPGTAPACAPNIVCYQRF